MRWPCLVSALLVMSLAGAQPVPTIAIVNARIFTGVAAQPWAEALAIDGDRIRAVGTTAEIRRLATPATRVIDGAGRLVIPGINDAHVHITPEPEAVRLEGPPAVEKDPTLQDVLERLKIAASGAPKGGWIFGEIGGTVIDDPKAMRFRLDTVAPNHRVMLVTWTGHGTLLNTAAMRDLGLADAEPDPPGGLYVRMGGSRAITGVAHEYADYALRRRVSMQTPPDAQRTAFRSFGASAAGLGITSLQWMLTALPVDDALRTVEVPQRLRLIDFPIMPMSAWRAPTPRRAAASPLVRVAGTKWILDGTPIERLMFLREPYTDQPETRGRLNFPAEDVHAFLRAALAAGEQPMFHAVGDAAIDTVLDALEKTGGEKWQALRPRIEHGDMFEPAHVARAKRFGVVLVQNPSHLMIRGLFEPKIGARIARTDLLKSALAAGIPLALGSDGPLNPFLNIMFATLSAVNPAEALTREQALAAYTRGAAFAEAQEQEKGTIAPGMLADVAMLSQDIFTIPTGALPATTSVLTIVNGRIVHGQ